MAPPESEVGFLIYGAGRRTHAFFHHAINAGRVFGTKNFRVAGCILTSKAYLPARIARQVKHPWDRILNNKQG